MDFKVGDKVLFKREKQTAVILKINSIYKVLVERSDGFQMNVSVKDIILVDTDTVEGYGSCFHNKDKNHTDKKVSKQQRSQTVLKIDLHIELLVSDYHSMSNYEIVQIQLNSLREKLTNSINSKITKLIIVHGIGSGVLRDEVHKVIQEYQLRYFLSKDGGSTEVFL